MFILIIICIVMFILALANWSQSQGYFEKFFKGKVSSDKNTKQKNVISGGIETAGASGSNSGVVVNNSAFTFDEDYAYDDDSDYFGEF